MSKVADKLGILGKSSITAGEGAPDKIIHKGSDIPQASHLIDQTYRALELIVKEWL